MPTATILQAVLLAAPKSTTPAKTSPAATYIFLLVIIGVGFIFFRSRSTAARRQRNTLMDLSVGEEVLTGAGIFGTVLDVEADRVTLETAPGTRITVVRSTIARRLNPPDGNSVAEQNWHDEGHDGVAEAAGWHDPSEHDDPDHDGAAHDGPAHEETDGPPEAVEDEPEANGAPGPGQGGSR
jgi:preprotein translocase subunit YajC